MRHNENMFERYWDYAGFISVFVAVDCGLLAVVSQVWKMLHHA